MSFLLQKSTRTAALYVLGCALCLAAARAQRLALCADWRFAALRELQRIEGPGEGGAEVLFLGSSCTARGVRPRVVAEQLEALGVPAPEMANLAVMGEPRQVNFLQLESYLRDHAPPRVVFVEVGKIDQPDRPHPALTVFMGPADALRTAWLAPYRWPSPAAEGRAAQRGPQGRLDAWLAPLDRRGFHVELALEALGRGPEDIVRMLYNRLRNAVGPAPATGGPLAERLSGWRNPYWAEDPPIALGSLAQQIEHLGWYRIDPGTETYRDGLAKVHRKAERATAERAITQVLPVDLSDPERHRFVRIYSALLARLCERHGIRLVFMQVPGFRERNLSPEQVALYEGLADLYRPDLWELYTAENYADPGHLTEEGAAHYSRELAGFLAGLLDP